MNYKKNFYNFGITLLYVVLYKYFQIDQGANIELRSGLGYTPLHVTAHYDRVGVAKFLLECGVNPDEEDFQVILLSFYEKI